MQEEAVLLLLQEQGGDHLRGISAGDQPTPTEGMREVRGRVTKLKYVVL